METTKPDNPFNLEFIYFAMLLLLTIAA